MRATWAVSEHQAKEAENVKIFKGKYSACIAGSSYHDLVCGHRILSKHPVASCGVNCKKVQDCKEMQDGEDVQNDDEDATISRMAMGIPGVKNDQRGRRFMLFEGIALSNEDEVMDDDCQVREQKICAIADAENSKLVKHRHRMCTVTKKCDDPKLHFFDQFLNKDSFKSIDGVEEELTLPHQLVTRKVREARKPDGRIGQVPKRDTAMAWLLREPAKHVEEDEAEKDVRSVAEMERDWISLQARQGGYCLNAVKGGAGQWQRADQRSPHWPVARRRYEQGNPEMPGGLLSR